MSSDARIEVLSTARAQLGESPLWHETHGALYWVDIVGRSVFRFEPATAVSETIASGDMVTAIGETTDGGLLFVTPRALLTWNDGVLVQRVPLSLRERVRTNDGKCDPSGRFWFGTMDYETRDPIAHLFMYDGDRIHAIQDDIILSNGLGWSPERDVMYHVDSIRRHVYAYRYDDETGRVRDRRILADMGDLEGVPDGLAVDVEGNLWVAIYDGWCLRVLTADGAITHQETLEVQKPTSLAFGGADRSDLYVTSAAQDLTADELAAQPASGCLLRLDPGASGIPPGVVAV